MTAPSFLEYSAHNLGTGTHRIVCPSCGGGNDKEKSLSLVVSSTGKYSYLCFRASCGISGGRFDRSARPQAREPRWFTADTVSLTDDRICWFEHRFGFAPPDTVYAPLMDRYVYSVRGPDQRTLRGYIARSFSGAVPKVLSYNELPGEPFIGWSLGNEEHLVIVEDWVSAEKVCSTGLASAVALNGTRLTLEMVLEISAWAGVCQVYLALDRDAYPKSLGYAAKYGGMFSPRLRVWRLEQDLKYCDVETIRGALSGNDDFSNCHQRRTENFTRLNQ